MAVGRRLVHDAQHLHPEPASGDGDDPQGLISAPVAGVELDPGMGAQAALRFATWRIACKTVVWSRHPKKRPI